MVASHFNEPDLLFQGEEVALASLDMKVIHILARKSPPLVYSLTAKQKITLAEHIEKSPLRSSATNRLLIQMLRDGQRRNVKHVFRKNIMKLSNLVGKSELQWFVAKGHITRESLLQQLQRMIFSEKSSFAQCGIFVSAAVQSIHPYQGPFTLKQLQNVDVDIVLACIADAREYSFLAELTGKVSWAVWRLLSRREVDKGVIEDIARNGLYVDPGNLLWAEREVMIGDLKLGYKKIDLDPTNALVIPLCPDTDEWLRTKNVKVYEINKDIAKMVVEGWSRKALKDRKFVDIPKTTMIQPGQTMILELPCDIGPYDADLQTVCIDKNQKPLPIIHFPATFLDRARTYPAGSNRVQVEIYNCGKKPIKLEDIYFRLRLYQSTDPQAKEKWSLRKLLQYAEHKKIWALEYLVRHRVLETLKGNASDQDGLGHLSNIDNLFVGKWQEGILFYQQEREGTSQNMADVLVYNGGKITLQNIDYNKVGWKDSCDRELINIFRNVCDVGREKRVIFICRDDISVQKLETIIRDKRVTDILCVPGKKTTEGSRKQLLELCKKKKIPLTSIEITQDATDEIPAVFQLFEKN
jgi:hypothetical protein